MLIKPHTYKEFKNPPRGQSFITIDDRSLLNRIRIDSVYRCDCPQSKSGESIIKMTHFGGSFVDTFMNINDFIMTEIDPYDGSMIRFESSVVGSSYYEDTKPRALIPDNIIGPNFEDKKELESNSIMNSPVFDISDKTTTVSNELSDNYNPFIICDTYEDYTNLPFSDTIGVIMSYLTLLATKLPFRGYFMIDSKLGLSFKDIEIPNFDSKTKEIVERYVLLYTQNLKKLVDIFVYNCSKYDGIHLYIMAYVSDFDVKVRVNRYEENDKCIFNYNLNMSDHCRMIRITDANYYDGSLSRSDYFEVFGDERSITNSLFLGKEDKEEFLYGYCQDNYITSYQREGNIW